MADLTKLLNTAKNQKNNGGKQPVPKSNHQSNIITSKNIDALDEMVFGAPTPLTETQLYETFPNGQKRKVYDPEEEMRMIKNQTQFNNVNSKMPSAILESIMQNPLIMQPIENPAEELMNEEVQIRTRDILGKLDAMDKAKNGIVRDVTSFQQPIQEQIQAPAMNMEYLATLIESIVDKKFKEYSNVLLNENKQRGGGNKVTLMSLGDNFKFMDELGNVYECQMKYIGKGKIK